MKKRKIWAVFAVCLVLLSYGCGNIENQEHNARGKAEESAGKELKEEEKDLNASAKESDYVKENYVSVQSYNGEGYQLKDANKEIEKKARASSSEIEQAVNHYFQEHYKTEVQVTNIVGARDAATVFVESVAEPKFFTYAIVPYDFSNEEIRIEGVRTEEGQVENAIHGWLYAKAYPEKFEKLNQFLTDFAEMYAVTGLNPQAVRNVGGNGFSNQYYLVNPLALTFEGVYNMYLENPEIEGEEIRKELENSGVVADDIAFGISLYMDEEGAEPDQSIMDELKTSLTRLEGIPAGTYALHLNDNFIDKRRASGSKTNTLKNIGPNEIIKE